MAGRLLEIFTESPRIEPILLVAGLLGSVLLARRQRLAGLGLFALALAGFGWGYLAGARRFLDFLQPGRQTYACYSALALLGGLGMWEGVAALGRRSRLAALLLGAALIGFTAWLVGPQFLGSVRYRLDSRRPFLSAKPTPQMLWIVAKIRRHVRPGERLLYEEGGFGPDPYAGGRYSGLLPRFTGVEVIGGPYLHAAITTNYAQFGEGSCSGSRPGGEAEFRRLMRGDLSPLGHPLLVPLGSPILPDASRADRREGGRRPPIARPGQGLRRVGRARARRRSWPSRSWLCG